MFYYDEHEDEPRPSRTPAPDIWGACLRRAIAWATFYAVLAAVIVVWDQFPTTVRLTIMGG